MPWSDDQKAAYIAAFIDGEGWVVFRHNPKRSHKERQIGFTNTDKVLFQRVCQLLSDLGFDLAVRYVEHANPKHAPRYNATIIGGFAAFKKFSDLIPLQHPGKVERLAAMLSSYVFNSNGTVARGMAAALPERKILVLDAARRVHQERAAERKRAL